MTRFSVSSTRVCCSRESGEVQQCSQTAGPAIMGMPTHDTGGPGLARAAPDGGDRRERAPAVANHRDLKVSDGHAEKVQDGITHQQRPSRRQRCQRRLENEPPPAPRRAAYRFPDRREHGHDIDGTKSGMNAGQTFVSCLRGAVRVRRVSPPCTAGARPDRHAASASWYSEHGDQRAPDRRPSR